MSLKTLLLGAGLAVASFAAPAQTASGNVMGDAKAGDTVVVESPAIGVRREVHLTEDGRFRISRLPIGEYLVTVRHADGTAEAPKGIAVRAGTTARVK
jgi:hypothetical protein